MRERRINRRYDALQVGTVATTQRFCIFELAPVMNQRGSPKYVIVPSAFISSLKPLSTSGSARSVLSLCRLFVFSNLTMPSIPMHASTNYISEHIDEPRTYYSFLLYVRQQMSEGRFRPIVVAALRAKQQWKKSEEV